MFEWCANFIASGFWQAILFMVVFGLLGFILSLTSRKVPLIQNIIRWGVSSCAYFIIWNIRHGVGWLIFGILSVIGLIASIITIVLKKRGANIEITDENIASFAEGANSNCPMKVDEITRLDSIKTMSGKVWIYRMTILKTTDTSKIIANLNSAGMRQNLLNNIRTSTDMKILRDNNVTIWYEYFDEAGNEIHTLKFIPSDYK